MQCWLNMFPGGSLKNLVEGTSNHSPILVATENSYNVFKKMPIPVCKCLVSWVGAQWESEGKLGCLWYRSFILDRLYRRTKQLDVWVRKLGRQFCHDIDGCKKHAERVTNLGTEEAGAKFMVLKDRLKTLLHSEETLRRQRAKVVWMRHGDMNSNFFTLSFHLDNTVTEFWSYNAITLLGLSLRLIFLK